VIAIAAAWFSEPYEITAAREFPDRAPGLGPLLGRYAFGPQLQVRIHSKDDRLLARANEGGDSELVYLGENRWFSRMLYTELCFGRDENGLVDRVIRGCSDGSPAGTRVDI